MRRFLLLHFPLLLVALLYSYNGRGQSVIVDSLTGIINDKGSPNGDRIEAMERLSKITATQNKLEEALEIAKEAKRLSYREEDRRYSALVHSTLSYLYVQQDSLERAFDAIDSAEWYAARTADKIVRGRVRFRHGWLEHMVEDTDNAYQHMLEALRLLEVPDTDLYKSNIYHYLAAIHAYWGNTGKQLYYTRLCLEAALASADPDAVANAYLSVGTSYLYRFRKDSTESALLDSSKYFYKRTLGLIDSLQQRMTLPSTGGIAALNIANLYLEFYPLEYRDSADVYLDQALAIGKRVDNTELIVNSYGIRSEYALKEGEFGRAEELLQMAMREVGDAPAETRSRALLTNALARVAEKSGKDSKALQYYKEYLEYDRQLFNEEKLSITQRLEAQYQSEKKELALASARQEAAFTKKLNRYFLILIIACIVALFLLYRSYRLRMTASRQHQLLLTSEKNKAEMQASLKMGEAARLKAERELMKERLDRLERELLVGTLQVEEKNRLLQDLRDRVGSLASDDPLHRQINRLIAHNQAADQGYDDIKAELAEIHPEFVAGLQKQAGNSLTRLDLKYCSYILMGLTNKDIAAKLNVDPKSIRMARYRLKQKLGLQKSDSLDAIISELGGRSASVS